MIGAKPRFSRSGDTSPYGKLRGRSAAVRVEPEIEERFAAKVSASGKPRAEVMRNFMRIVALGPDEAERMYGEAARVVIRMVIGKNGDKPISN